MPNLAQDYISQYTIPRTVTAIFWGLPHPATFAISEKRQHAPDQGPGPRQEASAHLHTEKPTTRGHAPDCTVLAENLSLAVGKRPSVQTPAFVSWAPSAPLCRSETSQAVIPEKTPTPRENQEDRGQGSPGQSQWNSSPTSDPSPPSTPRTQSLSPVCRRDGM